MDSEPITLATGTLRDRGLYALSETVKKMNARAKKLGLAPMAIRVVAERLVKVLDSRSNLVRTIRVHDVEVSGIVPRVNGWMVAAKIEFTEAGNLISSAPGIGNINPEWRTVSNRCEHCKTKRTRKDLVAIRHEDGREIVVGRNCLADYIRSGDAEGMLRAADFGADLEAACLDEDGERFTGKGSPEPHETLETILQAASLIIRRFGWVSASSGCDFRETTKSRVLYLLNPPSPRYRQDLLDWEKWVRDNDLKMNEHDAAEATKAREYLATLSDRENSDYLHNLRVLRDLDLVPASKVGLAVSIIPAAQKYREELVKRAERQAPGPREFYGCPGDRFRGLKVTVKRSRAIEGDYGVKTVLTFAWERGELTWFASGDKSETYVEGQEYVIDALVREHKTNERYGNSTIITRVADHVTPEEKAAAKIARKAAKEAALKDAAEYAAANKVW